jgi:hypothetical protein
MHRLFPLSCILYLTTTYFGPYTATISKWRSCYNRSRIILEYESESYVTTDGQPASLSWNKAPIWGLRPELYYLCVSYGLVLMGRPLWREVWSVFCMCCWPLPAQSFSGPSPLGLATIFYCLRFETSLFVASFDSQGHGGCIRSRLHTGIFFSIVLFITPLYGPNRKHHFQQYLYFCLRIRYRGNVFTEPLPRNGYTRYIILPPRPVYSKWSPFLRFSYQNVIWTSLFFMRTTCPAISSFLILLF